MADTEPEHAGQPGIASAALFGLCPRCGARTLFGGLASFAPRCRVCGLDFSGFNVGDGPAAFLTLIVGALIAVLAIWVQLSFEPPFWVHILLWVPLTTLAVVGGLRAGKAALLAAEYQRRAGEGRPRDE
ncbi:DUF983 domain-containing protein [Novosphingobium album (ex Liu et al. 2023)]|uniref:DUF983 domain-containing protein n=1 Tax=Novosphingobium album (ex Liu et al. 2023) TaxID=3031130 RepID=A0ABT5WSA5_9SPHN|nr:DUF983 domain-containing protein [Novosphingobium album (ex Liu et al. 2023)]MDE8652928.1 DUF983 domain-containing protein [Novosphingobium album (ex Liu et al. 2023)]